MYIIGWRLVVCRLLTTPTSENGLTRMPAAHACTCSDGVAHWGCPLQVDRVDGLEAVLLGSFAEVLIDEILAFEHQMLALPVLEHAEGLQGADNVVRVDGCLLANI